MKRKIIAIAMFISISVISNCQTVTSVQNGNWWNPATWNCMCVPYPGYTANNITINHHVVLDTAIYLPAANTITVSSTGTLISDSHNRSMMLAGGTFVNSGTTSLRYIYATLGSITNNDSLHLKSMVSYISFTNNGIIVIPDSMYLNGTFINNGTVNVGTFFNADVFDNYGTVSNADSITNGGTFTNFSGSSLTVDSMTNSGTLVNNGNIQYIAFTNAGTYTNNNKINFLYFTNLGDFTNSDSLLGTASFTNLGYFKNNSSGKFHLDQNFLNTDTLNYIGVFVNDGKLNVGNNWYNFDTIRGTSGFISVNNITYNSGIMKGTLHFCDLTPPVNAPYIDYNTGTIEAGIIFCFPSNIQDLDNDIKISVFPNPATEILNIKGVDGENFSVEIQNMLGQIYYTGNNAEFVDVSKFPAAVYVLKIQTKNGNHSVINFVKN